MSFVVVASGFNFNDDSVVDMAVDFGWIGLTLAGDDNFDFDFDNGVLELVVPTGGAIVTFPFIENDAKDKVSDISVSSDPDILIVFSNW